MTSYIDMLYFKWIEDRHRQGAPQSAGEDKQMGYSRLCNFYGELRYGTKGATVGIKNIKEAKGWVNSDNAVNPGMGQIDAVYMIPQTAYAKKLTRGFYCLRVTKQGTEYLNVTDLK